MACKEIINTQCENPRGGNTYEITINEGDQLIVTVETGNPKIKPKTILAPRGIELAAGQWGAMNFKVDWSIHPEHFPEVL